MWISNNVTKKCFFLQHLGPSRPVGLPALTWSFLQSVILVALEPSEEKPFLLSEWLPTHTRTHTHTHHNHTVRAGFSTPHGATHILPLVPVQGLRHQLSPYWLLCRSNLHQRVCDGGVVVSDRKSRSTYGWISFFQWCQTSFQTLSKPGSHDITQDAGNVGVGSPPSCQSKGGKLEGSGVNDGWRREKDRGGIRRFALTMKSPIILYYYYIFIGFIIIEPQKRSTIVAMIAALNGVCLCKLHEQRFWSGARKNLIKLLFKWTMLE